MSSLFPATTSPPQPQAGADVAYTPDEVVAALLHPAISPALPAPPRRIVPLMREGWLNAAKRRWVLPHIAAEITLVPRISFGGPGRGATSTGTHNHIILDLRAPRGGVTYRSAGHPIRRYMYDWREKVLL